MAEEIWRPMQTASFGNPLEPIDGYFISDHGNIESPTGTRLPQWSGKKGSVKYLTIVIHGKRYSVARLVLLTFVGKPFTFVCKAHHINNDLSDCRLENLEWQLRK